MGSFCKLTPIASLVCAMCVYFTDSRGFNRQLLNVVVEDPVTNNLIV